MASQGQSKTCIYVGAGFRPLQSGEVFQSRNLNFALSEPEPGILGVLCSRKSSFQSVPSSRSARGFSQARAPCRHKAHDN